MVVDLVDTAHADRVFHALADATRRDILARTLDGPHNVSALARSYPMSVAAVQKHVAVLERARLVTKVRRGREQLVRGNVETTREAARFLDRLEGIWTRRLDTIDELLATDPHGGPTP
jgi:DNA-binding transcriptional ArsR family regulator